MIKVGLFVLGFGLIMTTTTFVMNKTADFWQWSVDKAYNMGRDRERACREKRPDVDCSKHEDLKGHILTK